MKTPRPSRLTPRQRLGVRVLKWGTLLALLGGVAAIVGYWGLVFYFENRLPEVFESEDYIARTGQLTRIYSAEGYVLEELGEERRTVVPPKDLPRIVKLAVLAAEDAEFYQHDGLDYLGMARAMYKNIRDQKISQGASTITQQVAKTFFFSSERTISRKLKEVVMARRLEQELSKDEILYLYLNQIYWGHGKYGVAEAARHYFGKKLSALSLAQAAALAGMIAAPEHYSPFVDQTKTLERRSFVLEQMVNRKFISRERADDALREPLRLNMRGDPKKGLAGYAMDTVHREMVELLGADRAKRGGLRVYTTLDTRLQEEGEAALKRGLRQIDQAYALYEPIDRISKDRIAGYKKRLANKLGRARVRSGQVVPGVVTQVDRKAKAYIVDLGLGPTQLQFSSLDRYLGRLDAWELFGVGDVIRVSPRLTINGRTTADAMPSLNLDQGPQGALVSVDPHTRHIKALVGGYDHATHPFNRASAMRRQPGSTFKPIILAAALESKIVEPLSTMRNVPDSYDMGNGKYWKPKNFTRVYDGKSYTARLALAKSINVIAVKVLEKTGLDRAIKFARRVGISSDIQRDLSVALGSNAVSPLEITNAYATFASGGWYERPILITRIEDTSGKILFEHKPERKRGTTSKVAFRITEIMQAVITHGTGKRARALGRPAAGKTGTTDDGIDTWFVGYTPNLVTSVWVGFDDRRPVKKATGGRIAAPIWTRFMTAAHEGVEVSQFRAPPGLAPLPAIGQETVAIRTEVPDGEEPDEDARPLADDAQVDLLYE